MFGEGWGLRNFNTFIVCEVDFIYFIGIKWFYKVRVDFDYSACFRCIWLGDIIN